MTGPALHGTAAARAGRAGGSLAAAQPRLRIVLGLARIEAALMVRGVLVLGGLLAGLLAAWAWFLAEPVQLMWWWVDWRIGGAQLVLAMTVLAAAQLTAGRARRDAMADLYASMVLLGADAVLVQSHGIIGAPEHHGAGGWRGTGDRGRSGRDRDRHPVPASAGWPYRCPGAVPPDLDKPPGPRVGHLADLVGSLPDQLGWLPSRWPGFPPASARAAELAGVAMLAGVLALAVTARRARARGGLAITGIASVAVIFVTGRCNRCPSPPRT